MYVKIETHIRELLEGLVRTKDSNTNVVKYVSYSTGIIVTMALILITNINVLS